MMTPKKGMPFLLICSFLLLCGCLNQYEEKKTGVPSLMPSLSPPPDFPPSPIPSTSPPPAIVRQGVLTVACNVGGYGLFVDDGFILTDEGDGITTLTLQEGTHTILLNKIGCTPTTTQVIVYGGSINSVTLAMFCQVPLQPTPSSPPSQLIPSPTTLPTTPAPLFPTATPPQMIPYPTPFPTTQTPQSMPPIPPAVTITPPIPPPVTTFPPPILPPTPSPPASTTVPPPTPTPSVFYTFSALGISNIILDTSPQGQIQLSVPFSVPFISSNGKVIVNVAGNNPAYLRLWINGIEVQKGTTLPTSVEFPVSNGVFMAGSNTLILGWGIGSSPSPPTITILASSSVTVIKTGLCVTAETTVI